MSSVDQLLRAMTGAAPRHDLAEKLSLAAMDERRDEEALPLVIAAAAARPRDAVLHHLLGLLHRAVGDLEPAIAALDAALAQGPENPRLLHARARTALDAGLPSLDWFERARRLAPNDAEVILGQFAASVAERGAEVADALLVDMLRQHPGWIQGHAALIKQRFTAGWGMRWSEELDRATALAPRDPRLHHLRMMVLHRAGSDEEALAAVDAALAAAGEVEEVRSGAAAIATEHGDLARADALFAALDPATSDELAIHWCRHLLRRKAPERVIAFADALPSVRRPVAAPYLSYAYRMLGDARSAWLDDERLIRVIDLGEQWPLLDELAIALRALHLSTAQPLDQSVRGGTQTDGQLFSRIDPVIRALRERIRTEVNAYIDSLPPPDPAHPLLGRIPRHPRFVGSWSVRLVDQGYHESHIHNEGWLSSAFYVVLPEQGLVGDEGWLTFGAAQESLDLDLAPTRSVEPRLGRLVLFPSTSWHGTRPFSTGERMTVAFDIA